MFDNNTILRLGDPQVFLPAPAAVPCHGIMKFDYKAFPCGTPLMLDKVKYELGKSVRCFTLMSPRYGVSNREDLGLPVDQIQLIDLKPLTSTHRVLNVGGLNITKFQRCLPEYINRMGGITFVIKDEKSRRELPEIIKYMTECYPYASVMDIEHFKGKYLDGKDDEVLAVVSFFNLPYVVPIFNTKKVEGMGVSYCQVVRKESERKHHLVKTFKFDFVLSNYPDNLFVIDGVTVNPVVTIDDKYVAEITRLQNESLQVKGEDYEDPYEIWKKEKMKSPYYTGGKLESKPVVEVVSSPSHQHTSDGWISIDESSKSFIWSTTDVTSNNS